MFSRIILIFTLVLSLYSCSKDKVIYEPTDGINPYNLYKEGLNAFDKNDYFYANKKFSEAELNFKNIDLAAKSAVMASFSLYGMNFFDQAVENLERYLKIYPSDKNVIYANYLLAIIFFEQIDDEKKDLQPLTEANKRIDLFVEKYPNTDYATDLKFKRELIQNQLAAKELYVAKFYISTQKWVPAIKRLRLIVDKYSTTIYIEEALHRLVEVHYHIGLDEEAKNYAAILGYNYNSSRWFQQSYKILNKDYDLRRNKVTLKDETSKEEKSLIKKIIKMIK